MNMNGELKYSSTHFTSALDGSEWIPSGFVRFARANMWTRFRSRFGRGSKETLDPHSKQESVSGRPARSSQRVADRPVLDFTR